MPPPTQVGFTLLEMLVVVFILTLTAVALAAALPDWFGRGHLQYTSGQLAAGFKAARAQAARTGRTVTVVLDAQRRRIYLAGDAPRRTLTWPATVHIESSSRPLRFYPDGSSSGARYVLSQGHATSIVAVHPLTGMVGTP